MQSRQGLFYKITDALPTVKRECQNIINQAFPPSSGNTSDQLFRRLSQEMLTQSIDIINVIINWIDDTHEVLTGVGGNASEASWMIITKILRHIFERLYSPVRLAPMGLEMHGMNERGSMVLWSVMQTHLISQDLEHRKVKDHPIVVGAYTEWIVANSGRREAEEVRDLNAKLTTQVSSLRKRLWLRLLEYRVAPLLAVVLCRCLRRKFLLGYQ